MRPVVDRRGGGNAAAYAHAQVTAVTAVTAIHWN